VNSVKSMVDGGIGRRDQRFVELPNSSAIMELASEPDLGFTRRKTLTSLYASVSDDEG
jgi:hypothetical protein